MKKLAKKVRVLLVDDDRMVRIAMKLLIERESDILVIGETDTGEEAVSMAEALLPDVIVMDICLPRLDGFGATEKITRMCSSVAVVMITGDYSCDHAQRAVESGASGYMKKMMHPEELFHAIRHVAHGGVYLDRALSAGALRKFVFHELPAVELDHRQSEILRLSVWGHSCKEIAVRLSLTAKAVANHKMRAMLKMGFRSRVDLVRFAVEHDWFRRA